MSTNATLEFLDEGLPAPPLFNSQHDLGSSSASAEVSQPIAALSSNSSTSPVAAATDDVLETGTAALGPHWFTSSSSVMEVETRTERMARLQREVAEMQHDAVGGNDELLALGSLSQRLSSLSKGCSGREQRALSATIAGEVMKQSKQQSQVQGEQEISSSSAVSPAELTSSLSSRISALENSLGFSAASALLSAPLSSSAAASFSFSSSSSPHFSVISRMNNIETALSRLDKKSIEEAEARYKILRSDLKNLSLSSTSSSNKNSSSSSSTATSTSNQPEDIAMLRSLHASISSLDSIQSCLPDIVRQLEAMEGLRKDAASFDDRLFAIESENEKTARLASSLEKALVNVEEGWKESLITFQENIEVLDR
jgi:osmotically-inducible protein OsmY